MGPETPSYLHFQKLSPKQLYWDKDFREGIIIICHFKEGKKSLPLTKLIKVPNLAKLPVLCILLLFAFTFQLLGRSKWKMLVSMRDVDEI